MPSINNIGKKRGRGRPTTNATPLLVRFPPDELEALDAWIALQPVPQPNRQEAIRGMVRAIVNDLPAAENDS